jgi:carotenoid 1,2-hydratase
VGSVFSPYYARARRRGRSDAADHCALNVALYGRSGRWAMTERRRGSLQRAPGALAIGPSSLAWDGYALTIHIDEFATPLPARIRGRVRVYPAALFDDSLALDAQGLHRWRPISPCARVEVALDKPALRWNGAGYFDSNSGAAPLEDCFTGWHWSRARQGARTSVLYDVRRRDGSEHSIALRFGHDGKREAFAPPPLATLPSTRWGIARLTRASGQPSVVDTLEDTPFYARSLLRTRLFGEPADAMHESLSLERFRAPWVQVLLPFRMPRAPR